MKKLLTTTLLVATLAVSAQAEGVELLPITNSDYKFNPAIAIIGGSIQSDNSDDSDNREAFYGLEVSIDCPLIKVPTGKIRQQLNLTVHDENNQKLSQLNLNPHYQIALDDSVSVGFGPSFGVATVETTTDDDTVFTYGAGASVRADLTPSLFVGGEARYEATTDATLNGVDDNLNNIKVMAKIGYQF